MTPMPGAPDPATAARRVAEFARQPPPWQADSSLVADLLALLPVLDAVARGAEGGRVERMVAALDALAVGRRNDFGVIIADPRELARAALALADAEAAARWCFDMAAAPRDGTSILAADADGGLYVVDWDEGLNANAKASGHCWWGTEGSGKYGFHTSTFVAWCLPPAPPSTRP